MKLFSRATLAALLTLAATSLFAAAPRTIVFASDATYPPMELINTKTKEVTGYTIDVLVAAGKAAGFKPEFRNTAWDGIFAGLEAGRYDGVASSVSITEDRKKNMDFSVPYFEVMQGGVVLKDSPVKSLADLKGLKVGVQINTTAHALAKKLPDITLKTYDENGLAVEDLFNGRLGAVICDSPVAANYAIQDAKYSKKLRLAFVHKSPEPEYYGIAIKKGNTEVLTLINQGIKAITENGELAKLQKKWIPE